MNHKTDAAEHSVSTVCSVATDWDHRIITAVSIALGGEIGRADDLNRLRRQIEDGSGEDKLKTACEIAIAFIRWSQDLKRERDEALNRKCVHDLAKEFASNTTAG